MSVTAPNDRRELAHRTSEGIEVTLLWSEPSNQVAIVVLDTRSSDALEFEVDRSAALDAFNHPTHTPPPDRSAPPPPRPSP